MSNDLGDTIISQAVEINQLKEELEEVKKHLETEQQVDEANAREINRLRAKLEKEGIPV